METQRLPIHAILLVGGNGIRLRPLTNRTNKHLLPIGHKLMVDYAIDFLVKCGIHTITLVTTSQDKLIFRERFGYTARNGVELTYQVQNEPLGSAHAIGLCRDYVQQKHIAVLYGDNLFEYDLYNSCCSFVASNSHCRLHLATVPNPESFGVIEVKGDTIQSIEEKPLFPKANTVCTGFMLFRSAILDDISLVRPNFQNELNVIDLVSFYHKKGVLDFTHVAGAWFDAGTSFDSLSQVRQFIASDTLNKNNTH